MKTKTQNKTLPTLSAALCSLALSLSASAQEHKPTFITFDAPGAGRFVPLGSSQVTRDGLNVPFDTQKIMGGPNIDAGQHMSAAQAEDLSRYYGLTVPTQQAQPQGQQ